MLRHHINFGGTLRLVVIFSCAWCSPATTRAYAAATAAVSEARDGAGDGDGVNSFGVIIGDADDARGNMGLTAMHSSGDVLSASYLRIRRGLAAGESSSITLPPAFDAYADLIPTAVQRQEEGDGRGQGIEPLPVFWHIPKAGGTTVEDYLSECVDLVEASEVGEYMWNYEVQLGHVQEEELEMIDMEGDGTTSHPRHYVTVDTTTREGLAHAKDLGVVESQLADVVFTSLLYDASHLFEGTNAKGTLFALFRHPVQRAASMYYYLQIATWEATYHPDYAKLTLEEYATRNAEENWMVRFLVNKPDGGVLKPHDLEVAKEILRRKVLVGMIDDLGDSMTRFERYFGWYLDAVGKDKDAVVTREEKLEANTECRGHYLHHGGGSNHHSHPQVEPGTKAWDLLAAKNYMDIPLYEYAQELFLQQKALVEDDRVG